MYYVSLACGNVSKVIFPLRSFETSLKNLSLSNLHSVSLGKFASNNSCNFLGIHQIPKDDYFSKFSVDHARKTISKNSFIRFIDANTDPSILLALEKLDDWCYKYTARNLNLKLNSNRPRIKAYESCPLRLDKTLQDHFPDCFYLAGCWLQYESQPLLFS